MKKKQTFKLYRHKIDYKKNRIIIILNQKIIMKTTIKAGEVMTKKEKK